MAQTRIIQPLNIQHGQALPISSSPFTASAVTIREGSAATTLNLRTIMNQISGFTLGAWADLNPSVDNITVVREYSTNGGSTWQTLGTTPISGLVSDELNIITTTLESAGTMDVSVDDDSIDSNIDHDGTTRMRLNILITDDGGDTMRIYQPLSIVHGVQLPTGEHTDSAITLREGADATRLNLQAIINNISDVELTDWGELNPAPTSISPETEYSTDGGSTWQVLGTTAVNGLTSSELTYTQSLANGTVDATLADDSITQDTDSDDTTRFRSKILVAEGTRQLFIYIPLNLRHGYALPATTHTLSTLTLREGTTEQINLLTALNEIADFDAGAWSDINPAPDSITVTIEYTENGGSTWQTLGTVAFRDLMVSDFSDNANDALSDGLLDLTLAANTIAANTPYSGNARFRANILIDDGQ